MKKIYQIKIELLVEDVFTFIKEPIVMICFISFMVLTVISYTENYTILLSTLYFWFICFILYGCGLAFYRCNKLRTSKILRVIALGITIQTVVISNLVTLSPLSIFSFADNMLNNIDSSLLHFNIQQFSDGFYLNHSYWVSFFRLIYIYIFVVMIVAAIVRGSIFAVDQLKKGMLILALVNFIVIFLVFFFPTVGPGYIHPNMQAVSHFYNYIDPYFSFRQTRLHSVNDDISFPSYHIIMTLFSSYVLWSQKIYINMFIVIVGLLVALSTLVLGQHYLVDIIVSLLLWSFFAVLIKSTIWSKKVKLVKYNTPRNLNSVF